MTAVVALVPVIVGVFVVAMTATADPLGLRLTLADVPWTLYVFSAGGLLLVASATRRPSRSRNIVIGALLIALITSAVAFAATNNQARSAIASVSRASERLITSLGIPQSAQIYAARDPYGPGRTLRLHPEVGPDLFVTTDASTRFFMIDLAPTRMRGHPIVYAFLTDDGTRVVAASWFATIDGVPWTLDGAISVMSHSVALITVRPPESRTPSVLAPTRSVLAGLSDELSRGSVAFAEEPSKKAIIVNGGDHWLDRLGYQSWPLSPLRADPLLTNVLEADEAMASQMDDLGRLIAGSGYQVHLVGKGTLSPQPAFPASADSLLIEIKQTAASLQKGEELYLHFKAHGNDAGLELNTGVGSSDVLAYEALAQALRSANTQGRIRIAIDACEDAAAKDFLKDIPGFDAAKDLHTATSDKSQTTYIGEGDSPSFTKHEIDRLTDQLLQPGNTVDPLGSAIEQAAKQNHAELAQDQGPSQRLAPSEQLVAMPLVSPSGQPPAGQALQFRTGAVPRGQIGTPYAVSVVALASGGVGPYFFQQGGGVMPSGLHLNPDGTITGTPQQAIETQIRICATDQVGFSSCEAVGLAIDRRQIAFQPAAPPTSITVGATYPEFSFCQPSIGAGRLCDSLGAGATPSNPTGGQEPYTFSVGDGFLPPGLALSLNGILSGKPTRSGSYNFSVCAKDSGGSEPACGSVSVRVADAATPQPVAVAPQPQSPGTSQQTLNASGSLNFTTQRPSVSCVLQDAVSVRIQFAIRSTGQNVLGTARLVGTESTTTNSADCNLDDVSFDRTFNLAVAGGAVSFNGYLATFPSGNEYSAVFRGNYDGSTITGTLTITYGGYDGSGQGSTSIAAR